MSDTVRMRIRGLMPEKLIERARALGVGFQAVEPLGDRGMIVAVSARDAEKLSGLCRRFSIPCEVLSRRGRSALAAWLSGRWTLLIGLIVMLAACWLFLGRIWRVDIAFIGDAAARGDRAQIADALRGLGIAPGISRDIDARRLSEELMARCDGLSHALARVEGVRLFIEVAPESAAPEVYALDAARDLYADRNGIVVSVNVESGVPCVRPGDVVRRGQLLIRGEERISKEATRGIAALGEVVIRAWFEGAAEGETAVAQTEYTGRTSSASTLVTPWLEIPISEGARYEHQASRVDVLPIGGLYLPARIERVTRYETRTRQVEADRAALTDRLEALALADARAKLSAEGPKAFEIVRCWTRAETAGKALRVSAVLEITTNTAVTIEQLQLLESAGN